MALWVVADLGGVRVGRRGYGDLEREGEGSRL